MEYDGQFCLENGALIYYRVDPVLRSEIYQHGELVKASRMLYFYDASGNSMGFKPYFAEIEKLTTVIPFEARKVYLSKEC